ncbi:MAG: alpha/beta hydrolase [Roseibium sp.]|uniref:alpha/beta fold hydrolase n=1 Tax=Roseibium sp. TaxID=1936156 RepID=UPI002624CE4D|nr:alpha/beta hydrolase [Roseibium sp.]MCV0425662.1 alpha/beta hydrolase [Roseibium sp.]
MLHFKQSNAGLPIILFLHPGGFDGRMWEEVAGLLPDFNCVCPDLPGHGRSRNIPVTDFADASDAVAEVAAKTGASPVNIAGLSMGSYIGFHLMMRHSDLVENAVLSGFQHDRIEAPAIMRAMMHVSSWMMNSKRTREKMARSMGVSNIGLISHNGRPNASAATMRKISRLALDFDVSNELSRVSTRTLVLTGEKEHPAVKASLPVFQERMPNCEARVIPKLGHGWLARDPELYCETLRAWFTDLTLPGQLERVAG